MEPHLTATGYHLPYRITQCYLAPNTGKHTRFNPSQTGRYSIYLPWRDGRLSWPRWLLTYQDGLPTTDGHPSKYKRGSAQPGIEFAACWSQVWRPNHQGQVFNVHCG